MPIRGRIASKANYDFLKRLQAHGFISREEFAKATRNVDYEALPDRKPGFLPNKKGFFFWLRMQMVRDDRIGEFARLAVFDPNYPRTVRDWMRVLGYLEKSSLYGPKLVEQAKEARKECEGKRADEQRKRRGDGSQDGLWADSGDCQRHEA